MSTKTIQYRRRAYKVPDWVIYVATDFDGSIFGYREKPVFNGKDWDQGAESVHIADRDMIVAPGNSLEEYTPKPHYVPVHPDEVKSGDTITIPVRWHVTKWLPPILVTEIHTNFAGVSAIEGFSEDGLCRRIDIKKGRVWRLKK